MDSNCFSCGLPGHFSKDCPAAPKGPRKPAWTPSEGASVYVLLNFIQCDGRRLALSKHWLWQCKFCEKRCGKEFIFLFFKKFNCQQLTKSKLWTLYVILVRFSVIVATRPNLAVLMVVVDEAVVEVEVEVVVEEVVVVEKSKLLNQRCWNKNKKKTVDLCLDQMIGLVACAWM